ncbi:hypothetical protein CPB97_010967 [Podila verticillata]|nr:hypothetical protein CPB97_010967 [Podila verticillata]
MNSWVLPTNGGAPGADIHESTGLPQTLRKFIIFLAFVCLVMDIVIVTTKTYSSPSLGHNFGTFLPDLLTIAMFTKYVRNGLGRYPYRTRIILFTLLLISGLIWPIVSFVDAGTAYTSDGQIWDAYGLNRFNIFFVTIGFEAYVDDSMATFIHVVRSRDFLCLFYLALAALELSKSLRLFRTTAADEEGGVKGEIVVEDDGEEIEMAPREQKTENDKDFKNEYEAEDSKAFNAEIAGK